MGPMAEAGELEWWARKNDYKFPSLVQACGFYGVPFSESHRALADARAAAGIVAELERRTIN